MDNGTLRPCPHNYDLVNIETGKIEEGNLRPLAAKDRQNHLWARGIKTRLVPCFDKDDFWTTAPMEIIRKYSEPL